MLFGGGGLYQAGVGEDMMMKLAGTFGTIASVMMLSGCLGGGSDSRVTQAIGKVPEAKGTGDDLEARSQRAMRLAEKLLEQPVTDAARMPTEGRATYTGAAVFGAGTDYYNVSTPVIGDLTMTADFAAASVNGTVNRLQDGETSRMLAGTIGLNGSISGSDIAGAVSGNVEGYRVDGSFNGGFAGARPDYLYGEMEGTVGGMNYVGAFVGEKR